MESILTNQEKLLVTVTAGFADMYAADYANVN